MNVSRNDLWLMMLSTMRYSFRRTSYLPSAFIDMVKLYQNGLEDHQLKQMREETLAELRVETDIPGYLGMNCDVNTWKNFVITLDKIIEKRS